MTATPRHGRRPTHARLFAVAFALYWLVGFAHNYARTSPRAGDDVRVAVVVAAMVLPGLALLFFAWQIVRRRQSVETLGFVIATWPSWALTVVVGAGLAAALVKTPPARAAFAGAIVVPFVAVLMEEILFRPVLITYLHDAFARTRTSWLPAVVLSAAIWTLGHAPSKPASMLVGLFVTGVLLGALYAWSGSNVAGYVVHALANTGSGGAVMMLALYLVISIGGWLGERGTSCATPIVKTHPH